MDLVNNLLNRWVPSLSIHVFLSLFPIYLCYKALYFIWRSIFTEDVAGKVVVITGASSGIGEHLAYEYGRRGAHLVIGARRLNALQQVAEKCCWLGSPRAIPISTDVSKVEHCQLLIQEAINQFGRLDHLVLNAGVTPVSLFQDIPDITNFIPSMDINFWGMVYTTYFAAPYLRMTKGKIVVIGSSASWLNEPRLSFYGASKAAILSFFETLRTEFRSDIGITIVGPGLIESEMTKGKFLNKDGNITVDQEMRDVVISATPIKSVERMAKAVVDSACRGDRNLTVPLWYEGLFLIKTCFREATDLFQHWFFTTELGVPDREAISKKIVDLPLLKDILWPDSIRSPKIKTN